MAEARQLSRNLGAGQGTTDGEGPGPHGSGRSQLENAHALVPQEFQKQLRQNWRKSTNMPPALKIFSPVGTATWLIHSQDPREPDILFGLCDLGLGFPELGNVSLAELEELEVPARLVINGLREVTFRMKLERDLHFQPQHNLEVYVEAAMQAQQITENPQALERAALRTNNRELGRGRRRAGR